MPEHNIPWFRFFPSDFLSDQKVETLCFGARGLYISILSAMWLDNNCRVPAQPAKLRMAVKVNQEDSHWRSHLKRLLNIGVIFELDGYLYNTRLLKEWERSCERSGKASQAAKTRALSERSESVKRALSKRPVSVHPYLVENKESDISERLADGVHADAEA